MKEHTCNIQQSRALLYIIGVFIVFLGITHPQKSYAQCWPDQCAKGVQAWNATLTEIMDDIFVKNDTGTGRPAFDEHLKAFQQWLVPDVIVPLTEQKNEGFLFRHPIRAMRMMTRQLSTFAMQQTLFAGMFLDSQQFTETNRLYQVLKAEAHRDYTPSKDFCWFGTNVRGMAASENRGRFQSIALNKLSMNRHLGHIGTSGAISTEKDRTSRWNKFITTYCNPKDNNWKKTGSGLELACGASGGGETTRINIDIDYPRLIEQNRTLDVSFDSTAQSNMREDVIALGNNLYGHNPLTKDIKRNAFYDENSKERYQELYLALRAVAAKRNVAENSYNAIVELKSSGGTDTGDTSSAREFLGSILQEIGVPHNEVFDYIGKDPSYYAQLEILAKKIYQNPDFFVKLYDKPANVQRKGVALKAIELMLDRAIYESQLRREMATSVLLSVKLRDNYKILNNMAEEQ